YDPDLAFLKAKLAQARVLVRPPPRRPMVFAVRLRNRQVVDAGNAPPHQAVFIKLPVLVAIGPEPLSRTVMPLVGETHRDPVAAVSPAFLDQPVLVFLFPFAPQEGDDGFPA